MIIHSLIATCARDEIVSVRPDDTTLDAAEKLRTSNIGALLVTDHDQRVAGMLSERDLVRAYAEMGADLTKRRVDDLMTREVITCTADDDAMVVMDLLHHNHIRHIPVVRDGKAIAMLSLRDFEHACNELKTLALTDPLTGLPNRRAFMDTAEKELARHRRFDFPLSLALVDLDHFKSINDRFGHDAGDQVLCCFARILLNEFRSFDCIGRIGGEEFALIFPQTDPRSATTACQRVMSEMQCTTITTDAGEVKATISVGLTSLCERDASASDLIKRADGLLYSAKSNGRDQLITGLSEVLPHTSSSPSEYRPTAPY